MGSGQLEEAIKGGSCHYRYVSIPSARGRRVVLEEEERAGYMSAARLCVALNGVQDHWAYVVMVKTWGCRKLEALHGWLPKEQASPGKGAELCKTND